MHAYERHALRLAYGRGMPMRCTPTVRDMPMRWLLWKHAYERHAYERHAYEMVYGRGTPIRWPMRDARLCTPMRDAPMRWPPMRDTPMRWPVRSMSMRDVPMRDTPMGWSL
jgi:hypothetical protein